MAEHQILNITVLSIDIETKHSANIHYIHMERIYDHLYGSDDNSNVNMNMSEVIMADNSAMTELFMYKEFCNLFCSGL